MTQELNDKSESAKGTKRRGRKKSESSVKSIGLFDHIKHIKSVQDPDYFKSLTDQDKKSFNHFMILRGLSMNPALLDDISSLFRYFDKIPSPQFYQLVIGLIPPDRNYYPWVKAKKLPVSDKLIELISTYFEISNKEATEYAVLLSNTPNGRKHLEEVCRDYGLTDTEVEEALNGDNKDE